MLKGPPVSLPLVQVLEAFFSGFIGHFLHVYIGACIDIIPLVIDDVPSIHVDEFLTDVFRIIRGVFHIKIPPRGDVERGFGSLVGKFFGKALLGHYDRAYHLSSLLPNELTHSLSSVVVSALSRMRDDPDRFRAFYAKAVSMLAFISFPGSVLLTLLGKDIILLLIGPQWHEAGRLFTAMGPSIGLVVVYYTNNWLHISLGRADRLFKWSIYAFAASVVFYSAGTAVSSIGVAVAYSALFYVLLIPALSYAGRPANLGASFYLALLWKYWLAAFGAGLAYYAIFHVVGPSAAFYGQLSGAIRILLGAVAYAVLYLGLIVSLFRGLRPFKLLLSISKDMVS